MVDRIAIVDLYNHLIGVRWINSTNWLSELPSSLWYGIRVNEVGKIKVIELSNNNLEGDIPDNKNFSKLVHLEILCLSSNMIKGTIPLVINKLQSLQELNLSWNQLEGTIPDSLYELKCLRILRLDNNKLEGCLSIKLIQLENLKLLNISRNLLSGNIPPISNYLSYLQVLDITGNLFDGTIPTTVHEWRTSISL